MPQLVGIYGSRQELSHTQQLLANRVSRAEEQVLLGADGKVANFGLKSGKVEVSAKLWDVDLCKTGIIVIIK